MAFRHSLRYILFLVLFFTIRLAGAETPYWVRIADGDTNRGVPLVQLVTPDSKYHWTDSNGVEVIEDRALQGKDVPIRISSDGYLFAQKVQGEPGATLHVQAGKHDELKIKRLNMYKLDIGDPRLEASWVK